MRDPHSELFAALAAPFRDREVRSRRQSGRDLPYVTARVIMNRLDDVVGPSSWWDDYATTDRGVICRLTLLLPDGGTITKCDAGGKAGLDDEGDDEKSAYSDAFKRAAVKFGIGRYLYGDGVPDLGPDVDRDARNVQAPQPPVEDRRVEAAPQAVVGAPRGGRALFGWAKDNDVLDVVQKIGRSWEYPNRVVDWDADQAAAVHREVVVKHLARRRAEPQTVA